ncbi:hypothetical protein V8G54_010424 [Vigna mungo]|uniref:Uncharacterized protein n=1 Tax=Vigna mungo TaxID=3915 RepID=A0AAQ3NYU7_VIGMU
MKVDITVEWVWELHPPKNFFKICSSKRFSFGFYTAHDLIGHVKSPILLASCLYLSIKPACRACTCWQFFFPCWCVVPSCLDAVVVLVQHSYQLNKVICLLIAVRSPPACAISSCLLKKI